MRVFLLAVHGEDAARAAARAPVLLVDVDCYYAELLAGYGRALTAAAATAPRPPMTLTFADDRPVLVPDVLASAAIARAAGPAARAAYDRWSRATPEVDTPFVPPAGDRLADLLAVDDEPEHFGLCVQVDDQGLVWSAEMGDGVLTSARLPWTALADLEGGDGCDTV